MSSLGAGTNRDEQIAAWPRRVKRCLYFFAALWTVFVLPGFVSLDWHAFVGAAGAWLFALALPLGDDRG